MRSHTDLWGSEVRFDLLWAKRWSARRFYIGEATTKKKKVEYVMQTVCKLACFGGTLGRVRDADDAIHCW